MEKKSRPGARRRGAPSKYDPKVHVTLARGLARCGLTMAEIAAEMHVAKQTLYKWRADHPEFMDALNDGRALADLTIEDSLYQRAKGYRKKTIRRRKSPQGEVLEETIEDIPPDTTACIFWLKNRKPEQWRDRREVDTTQDTDARIKESLRKMGL